MNLKILLFIFFAAAITSCSTTYRSGQTPDDLYYSPARPVEARQEQETEKKDQVRTERRGYTDRQIIMSIHDPRWRLFNDDYDAYYDPYRYGYTCGYYYNPYYYPSPVYFSGTVFTNPKNSTPRMVNLGSYNNYSNMVVVNPKTGYTTQVRATRTYNNSNTDYNNTRKIIIPTTPTYSNSAPRSYDNNSNNTRTYSPSTNNSSNSSSGSSSSGSSGAPVSRPHRGG